MNFGQITTELYSTAYARFDSSQSASAAYWVNDAYSRVWAAGTWPWRFSHGNSLTLTPNTRASLVWSPTSQANLRVAFVNDEYNDLLPYITPAEYFSTFGTTSGATAQETAGHPSVWTWVDGSILWGPIPDAAYAFTAVFERNVYVRDLNGTIKNGVWDGATNSDTPAWTEPFHYMLVLGAAAAGLLMENDPSYAMFEAAFLQRLELMKAHYLEGTDTTGQFARDSL